MTVSSARSGRGCSNVHHPDGVKIIKALLSTQPGDPDTLELVDIDAPSPGKGELAVRVLACAINYPDVLIIEDKYQMRPPRPFAPGAEIAGEVIAVGEGVEGWSEGDRLIAVRGDVRSLESNREAVDAAVSSFGRLDLFVGNAGVRDARRRLELARQEAGL